MAAFVVGEAHRLRAVVSNLINNAVDAIEGEGSVIVHQNIEGDHYLIRIDDTGKGMTPAQMAKLGQRGESWGKDHGHGIGVSGAIGALAEMGGTLSYRSAVGRGTQASIRLRTCPSPGWFPDPLVLISGREHVVFVVDDDPSIHHVWAARFAAIDPQRLIDVRHCASGAEALEGASALGPDQEVLFLFDQELRGDASSGREWIEAGDLFASSLLVTSRFENEEIIMWCVRHGVRLLPKPLAHSHQLRWGTREASKVRPHPRPHR